MFDSVQSGQVILFVSVGNNEFSLVERTDFDFSRVCK